MADAPSAPKGLASLAVSGVAWNVAGSATGQVLRFAAKIVVARWLAPEDFAVAGLALAIIGVFQVLTFEGFAQALVRRQELRSLTIHSVFWPLTLGAAGVAVLVLLLAGLLASFYDQPVLAGVLPLLACGLVLATAGAVPHALLQRAFRFRAINLAELAAALVTALGGIGLAVAGFGYQALIVPVVAGYLARTVALFLASGYRPSFRFAGAELLGVSRFGLSQFAAGILRFLSDNADYLVMSRMWPAASFGHYYFAYERARQPFQLLYPQLASALLPSFSQLQGSVERLRSAYLSATQAFVLLLYPLHVWLILLADPLVPWVFGQQWEPAVPVFRIFAGFAFLRAFSVAVPPLLLALDKAHWDLAFNLFRTAAILPGLAILYVLGADTVTTALVLLGIWTLQTPVMMVWSLRLIRLPLTELCTRLGGVVLSSLAMAAVGLGSRALARAWDWPAWADVLACVLASGACFALLNRTELRGLAQRLRRHLGARASSSDGAEA